MKKTVCALLLLSISCSSFPMASSVDRDVGNLYWYCVGTFRGIRDSGDSTVLPSQILHWLSTQYAFDINMIVETSHMPASEYLVELVEQYYDDLDEEFQQRLDENGDDNYEAWTWFEGHYKEVLAREVTLYKQEELCLDDMMEKHGCFVSGDTMYCV